MRGIAHCPSHARQNATRNKKNMNDKTLTVKIANVYGNRVIYPVCETAKKFAAMLGTKTLTMEAKRHIEGLGYTFTLQQETL